MLGIQIAFKEFSPFKGIWHSSWTGGKQFHKGSLLLFYLTSKSLFIDFNYAFCVR